MQAHDAHHDWIKIRRGHCRVCGKTFTFLPPLSLPYTRHSLLARGQALQRRFVEHRSWEEATPALKDANHLPDPSTLRRWARGLDPSQPACSFLRQTLALRLQQLGLTVGVAQLPAGRDPNSNFVRGASAADFTLRLQGAQAL